MKIDIRMPTHKLHARRIYAYFVYFCSIDRKKGRNPLITFFAHITYFAQLLYLHKTAQLLPVTHNFTRKKPPDSSYLHQFGGIGGI